MSMLPDIDATSWLDYQREQVGRELDNKISGFGLDRMIGDKIAGLQNVLGGIVEPEPPPPPPAPTPEPPALAPLPEPAQSFAPLPAPVAPAPDPNEAFNTALREAPNPDAFIQAFNLSEGDTLQRVNSAMSYSRSAPVVQPAQPSLEAPARPSAAGGGGYMFPVSGYQGEVPKHWGEVTGGADLFAAPGTPVVAMRGGRVTGAGSNPVGGNYVSIQGDDGNEYYYAHLQNTPSVKSGQNVSVGTYLGGVGDTGNAKGKGAHLHLGVGPQIQAGADKYGGTGGEFDATSLLRSTLSGAPQAATQTTAELSGAAKGTGGLGEVQRSIMAGGAQVADWLGAEGQKALQAVLVTEGGMGGAVGDNGQSFGPLQFYTKGQLANFAKQNGMSMAEASQYVRGHPLEAISWAIGSPSSPGYLGRQIQRGIEMGLAGPALATFAQQYGQVSVSPERAGRNYAALFGADQLGVPITDALGQLGRAKDEVTSAVGNILGPVAQQVTSAPGSILGPAASAAGEAVGSILGPAARAVGGLGETAGSLLGPVAEQLQEPAAVLGRIGRAITPGGPGLSPEEAQNAVQAASIIGPGILQDLERQRQESLLRSPQEQLLQSPLSFAMGGAGVQIPPQLGAAVTAGLERAGMPGYQQMGMQIPTPLGDINLGPRELIGLAAEIATPGGPELGGAWLPSVIRGELADLAARGSGRLSQQAIEAIERLSPSVQMAIRSKLPAEATIDFATGGLTRLIPGVDTPPGAARRPNTDPLLDPDPINRSVAAMFRERPPEAQQGNLMQRGVRAWTNRFEATDRFQQDALREAGLDGGRLAERTPEELDLKALIREQAGDPVAEMRVQRDLRPAIRLAGDDHEYLGVYLVHNNDVDTAQHVGRRAEQDWLRRDLGPIQGEARLQRARASLRMRLQQRVLADIDGDPVRIAQTERNVARAERIVNNSQAAYDTARRFAEQTREVEARMRGEGASRAREFSGGRTAADAERGLYSLRETMGAERFARLEDAANAVYGYVRGLRDTMVDGGLISRETADEWEDQMPHWVPTRILDYLDEGGAEIKSGTRVSLGDNGVRRYSEEGTTRFRENPLGSLISLTHQVESKARRNRVASAFVELDNLRPVGRRRLERTDRPPTATEPIIQRINNGTVERYVAPPDLATAINSPVIDGAPGLVRDWVSLYRSLLTSLNPAFALVRNPTYDIPNYFGRELIRSGGNPLAIPRLLTELVRGYADSFEGLLQGELRGAGTQQYLEGGGGMSTLTQRKVADRAEQVRGMTTPKLNEISSREDLGRVLRELALPKNLGDALTAGPLRRGVGGTISSLAERVELGPRVAATRMAQRRGATPVRATLAGRTTTMDFNEAGTLARTLNSYIPFFNVGAQTPAVLARAIREDPAAAAATLAYTVGMPTALTEAWNRSDPKRSQDYDDIPQYIKDQGIVLMLPGEPSTDRHGNKVPNHFLLRTGVATPFALMAREATNHAIGGGSQLELDTPIGDIKLRGNKDARTKEWGDLLASMLWSVSPVRGNDASDLPLGITPEFIPGASTALQLAQNRDFFANRDIISEKRDREAPQLAREVSGALTSLARLHDPRHEIHPSQVDFATRDLLGGWGTNLLAGRDIAPGAEERKSTRTQDIPVVGGIAQAAGLGGAGGERLFRAREETISDATLRKLQAAGISYMPNPTDTEVKNVKLNREEQTQYQQLANKYIDDNIQKLLASPSWAKMSRKAKDEAVQRVAGSGRTRAGVEVLKGMPIEEVRRRRAELAAEER